MEPDGLMPGGTFVEFSWYSFESDGPMDTIPGPLEEEGSWGNKETPSESRKDGLATESLRLPPLDGEARKP